MKSGFKSKAANGHIRVEENQWAEILAKGNAFASVLLLQDQKLCAVCHEIERALNAGKITVEQAKFFAAGLGGRIDAVLKVLGEGVEDFQAKAEFVKLKVKLEKPEDGKAGLDSLKKLAGQIHLA
ncbi:MAG: hypothetical protein Q8N60_01105, partial [Candidatus Diapherotrites archaeon]|nr:hypothetical protein [Candidatus Diapherotrites archaeon]